MQLSSFFPLPFPLGVITITYRCWLYKTELSSKIESVTYGGPGGFCPHVQSISRYASYVTFLETARPVSSPLVIVTIPCFSSLLGRWSIRQVAAHHLHTWQSWWLTAKCHGIFVPGLQSGCETLTEVGSVVGTLKRPWCRPHMSRLHKFWYPVESISGPH